MKRKAKKAKQTNNPTSGMKAKLGGGIMSGKCPLQEFACDLCVYKTSCLISKTEQNTKEIIGPLQEVLHEIRKR